MRRLVRHGIVAASLCGLATATALATVPHGASQVDAVPVTSSANGVALSQVDQSDRTDRVNRSDERPQISAQVLAARTAALAADQKAIATNSAKLKKAAKREAERKAEAARLKKAAEAEAAAKAKIPYDPNSTSPREIGKKVLADAGYNATDFACFDNIIKRESMWQVNATNRSSGAYGIPQALPGSKMASAGSDWRTNPATQVKWAIGYMESRYGGICSAWAYKRSHGVY